MAESNEEVENIGWRRTWVWWLTVFINQINYKTTLSELNMIFLFWQPLQVNKWFPLKTAALEYCQCIEMKTNYLLRHIFVPQRLISSKSLVWINVKEVPYKIETTGLWNRRYGILQSHSCASTKRVSVSVTQNAKIAQQQLSGHLDHSIL